MHLVDGDIDDRCMPPEIVRKPDVGGRRSTNCARRFHVATHQMLEVIGTVRRRRQHSLWGTTDTEQVWCQREQANLGRNEIEAMQRAARRIKALQRLYQAETVGRAGHPVADRPMRMNRRDGIFVAREMRPPFLD
jgi:hypothetical protein